MENIWIPPEDDFVKISVHYVHANAPFPNRNQYGVATIIKDNLGRKLWGAAGPIQGGSSFVVGSSSCCGENLKIKEEHTHTDIVFKRFMKPKEIETTYSIRKSSDKLFISLAPSLQTVSTKN